MTQSPPKCPPPNTITLRVRISTWILGNTNIQFLVEIIKVIFFTLQMKLWGGQVPVPSHTASRSWFWMPSFQSGSLLVQGAHMSQQIFHIIVGSKQKTSLMFVFHIYYVLMFLAVCVFNPVHLEGEDADIPFTFMHWAPPCATHWAERGSTRTHHTLVNWRVPK